MSSDIFRLSAIGPDHLKNSSSSLGVAPAPNNPGGFTPGLPQSMGGVAGTSPWVQPYMGTNWVWNGHAPGFVAPKAGEIVGYILNSGRFHNSNINATETQQGTWGPTDVATPGNIGGHIANIACVCGVATPRKPPQPGYTFANQFNSFEYTLTGSIVTPRVRMLQEVYDPSTGQYTYTDQVPPFEISAIEYFGDAAAGDTKFRSQKVKFKQGDILVMGVSGGFPLSIKNSALNAVPPNPVVTTMNQPPSAPLQNGPSRDYVYWSEGGSLNMSLLVKYSPDPESTDTEQTDATGATGATGEADTTENTDSVQQEES